MGQSFVEHCFGAAQAISREFIGPRRWERGAMAVLSRYRDGVL